MQYVFLYAEHLEHRLDATTKQTNPTAVTAIKHDTDKLPYHLLSICAVEEMLKVLAFGAIKYPTPTHNWRLGFKWSRLLAASARHLFAFMRGEDRDPETGLLHTAHLMCCAMFLTEHVLRKLGSDDRYPETEK